MNGLTAYVLATARAQAQTDRLLTNTVEQAQTAPYIITAPEAKAAPVITAIFSGATKAESGQLLSNNAVYKLRGKNMLNSATNTQNAYITPDGSIGSDTVSNYTALIPVTVGTTYTFSGDSVSGFAYNKRVHGYDSGGNWVELLGAQQMTTAGGAYSVTVTIPAGVAYVRLSYQRADTRVQFEQSDAKTDYEPYFDGGVVSVPALNGISDLVDTYDALTGSVLCRVKVVDMGDLTYSYSDSEKTFSVRKQDVGAFAGTACRTLSAVYTSYASKAALQDMGYCQTASYFYFRNDSYTSSSAFKAAMAGVKFAFELATPESSHVEPVSLRTQKGDNMLVPVSGDILDAPVEFSYCQDLKLYIDKKIAESMA